MDKRPTYEELEQRIKELERKVRGYEPAGDALGGFEDVTEGKRGLGTLRRERNLVSRIMETSPAGIVVVNPEGQITFANFRAEQVLGLTKTEIGQRTYDDPGWHITDYDGNPFPTDELPFRRVMRTGQPVFDVRHAIEWPDERRVLLSINAAPLFDEASQLDGMVAAVEDFTDRVRAEEALRESEKKFRNIIESIPLGMHMYQLEPEGRLVFIGANPAADQILGVDNAQFIGKTIEKAFPALTETEIPEQYRRVASEGHTWQTDQIIYEENEIAGAFEVHAFQTSPGKMAATFLDITERKRAEEALRESENKFRQLFHNANDAIYLWKLGDDDTLGRCLEVNDVACRMLGYSRNELLTMTPKDIDTQKSARRIPEITKELLTKGHATFEMTNLAKDGRKISVEINSLVFTLSGERVILSITRDITERKKAEEVLKRRDAILQAVNFAAERFLTTPDLKHEVNHVLERLGQATGVDRVSLFENHTADNGTPLTSQRYEWTASGIKAEIDNPHLQNITPRETGYGRWVEILGQGEPIFGHTRDFPPGEQALLVLTEVLSLAIVPIFIRKTWWGFINFGMCRVEHEWSTVELEALQTAANLLGTAIERQQAEKAVRESEEKYRRVVENANEAIVVAQDGMFKFFNPKTLEITGYSEAELATKPFVEVIHPDDQGVVVERHLRRLQGEQLPDVYSFKIVDRAGDTRWVEIGVVLIDWEGKPATLNFLSDITERKQVEAEREQLIAELEAKNAELERFTYTVSHDLKSPLVTINGFLGLLAEDVTKRDRERVQRDIEQIRDATQKMKRLLDDLLELSRIGRLINPPEVVELGELAHEAVALVAGQIAERGVQVVIASGLPVVYGDRPRLLEVLQNLIDNAVKFMGEQPAPRIEIGVRRTDTETVCYVKDNGKGIEPRYHDKVFGLFERLDQTIEGTGIGLALVRRIVEVHGGRIWIESEGKGQGSTFCFTLPESGGGTGGQDSALLP